MTEGAGGPPEGDRLLFGDSFVDADELALSGMFGEEFARAAFALEPGAWRGPVKSGYGVHLVFVSQRTPTAPKPFETVRDAVRAEWRGARQSELSRDYLVELRRKYGVELDDGVNAVLGSEPVPSVAEDDPAGGMGAGSREAHAALPDWLRRIVLAAAMSMLLAGVASAHEVRPAYLSVREDAPNDFSVLLKTPMQGDARLALRASFRPGPKR